MSISLGPFFKPLLLFSGLFFFTTFSPRSWADEIETNFETLPYELQIKIFEEKALDYLLDLSVKELDTAARNDKDLRRIILSNDFYQISKRIWLARKNYKNLVDFPQYLVLREIRDKFNDFEWRKKAVHLLLDLDTQFAEIPDGTFQMGSRDIVQNREIYEMQHWVHLSSSTWMQRIQFTQLLLVLVTGKNRSISRFSRYCPEDHLILNESQSNEVQLCPRHPAEWIVKSEIRADERNNDSKSETIVGLLSDRFGIRTRLPTEAEWERATRGSSNLDQPYFFGELSVDDSNLKEHAWYEKNSNNRPHRVAGKKPNSFGLFDLLGNVWEFTEDFYSFYTSAPDSSQPLIDPICKNGDYSVIRGGDCDCDPSQLRSAYRYSFPPGNRWYKLGFRLVRIPE